MTGASRHLARKRFGQHFLEPQWADKVVQAIAPDPGDAFLEIGAGLGVLTVRLAEYVRHVIAFEIDRDLAATLRTRLSSGAVVEGDFLDTTADRVRALVAASGPARLRVAGNLPYNVGSPILFKLLELHAAGMPAVDATLMLQREVADRLTAAPGTRAYGALTILIGRGAAVDLLLALPPGAFRPIPKVRSALVRLTFRPATPAARDERLLAALVTSVFGRRRKTLRNAVEPFAARHGMAVPVLLEAAAFDGRRRPETLGPEEFVRLADAIAVHAVPAGGGAVL